MALGFKQIIYDGRRTKIFTVTETAANLAASTLGLTWAACGMTNFQGLLDPLEWQVTKILSAADENVSVALLTATNTDFSFRKLTVGANATAIDWKVTLRIPRGIMG